MYGMPTRVRPLYLGARNVGKPDVDFSTVDRELDLAVFEFAPGRSLVKDKRRYLSIGLSGTLKPPRPRQSAAAELEGWLDSSCWVATCGGCGAVATADSCPSEAVKCCDCGASVQSSTYRRHVTPAAFTTAFTSQPVDEGEELTSFRRVVAIEANEIRVTPSPGSNTNIGSSEKARVLRLNEGLSEGAGDPKPFSLIPVEYQKVAAGNGEFWRLPKQLLLESECAALQKRERLGGLGDVTSVMLMSRKTTDALFITPTSVPPELDVGRSSRSMADTGVRAALVSATQLIVQRAALELDIDPEEFDPLEPRVREGMPVLQFADYLANGAGFCRRLAEGAQPLVLRLVRSMLESPGEDRLIAGFTTEEHRATCHGACYRCLQRYGNRSYHGLLDWRTAVSFLRLLIDGRFTAGLDGRWDDAFELADWRQEAGRWAADLASLSPDSYRVETAGRLDLPCVVNRKADERFAMIHPFWKHEFVHQTLKDRFRGKTWLVDTFQCSRRPQRVFELARQGAFERGGS
jgi:hypothetical protein